MGFFSTNEHSNLYRSYEFPVVEGYNGTIGCGLALIEGYQNDLALFSAAVVSDITEMGLLQEGADSEVLALQEASIGGMMKAIKDFFVKLGAKIKSIFTAFIAKLESYFTKDLKAYVKKYERSLDRKDFKDMKVKIMPIKGDKYTVDSVYKADGYNITALSRKYSADADDTTKKDYEDYDREDGIKRAYNDIVNSSVDNNSDFDEWYHDQLFSDEEVTDDWDYAKVKKIANRMTDETKALKEIDTFYKKVLKDISKIIKEIDDEDKRITKLYKDSKDGNSTESKTGYQYGVSYSRSNKGYKDSGDIDAKHDAPGSNFAGNKTDLSTATKAISIIRQDASCYQDVVLHISQVVMKEAKVAIAQDKKVFAAAVAYKTITGESTLLSMIAECAYDEVIEDLDRIA